MKTQPKVWKGNTLGYAHVTGIPCPTCKEVFLFQYQQHRHASDTGHRQGKTCQGIHFESGRKCRRHLGHPGFCGFVTTGRSILWMTKKGQK